MMDPDMPEGVPLVMAVSTPLKLIAKDGRDRWKPSLQDINRSTYDYLKLNRASGFIDGNVSPYMMLVGFDGSWPCLRCQNFLSRMLRYRYSIGGLPRDAAWRGIHGGCGTL